MTVLISGYLDVSRQMQQHTRERLVQNASDAMNFGGLERDLKLYSNQNLTMARLALFTEFDPLPELPEIAQDTLSAACGDFRLYNTVLSDAECRQEASVYYEKQSLENNRLLDNIKSLEGDFAFAHWNVDAGILTLARDQMGVRPLVYSYVADRFFCFASLPAGVLAMGVEQTTNHEFVSQLLASQFDGQLELNDINFLPAGAKLTLSGNDQPTVSKYWNISDQSYAPDGLTFDNAAEHLADLIDQAVQVRIDEFDTPASHLSSGLDSSAVTVLTKRYLERAGKRLLSATLRDDFNHPNIKKRGETTDVQNLVQTEGGIDLIQADVPPVDPLLQGKDTFAGTSFTKTQSYSEGAIATQLAARRATVVLTGLGGDQFSSAAGLGAVTELLLRGKLKLLGKVLIGLKKGRGWSPIRVAAYALARDLLPEGLAQALNPTILTNRQILTNLEPFLSRELLKQVRNRLKKPPVTERGKREVLWNSGDIQMQLLELAHIGATNGIHYTAPLLDIRVVSFAHSLPVEFFARGGHNRAIMRAALDGILPDRMRFKATKAAASIAPMTKLALNKQAYLNRLDELLNKGADLKFGVRLLAVRQVIEDAPTIDQAIQMDNCGDVDNAAITAMLVFDIVEKMRKVGN